MYISCVLEYFDCRDVSADVTLLALELRNET